jgi:hypothetical protein
MAQYYKPLSETSQIILSWLQDEFKLTQWVSQPQLGLPDCIVCEINGIVVQLMIDGMEITAAIKTPRAYTKVKKVTLSDPKSTDVLKELVLHVIKITNGMRH